MLDRAQDFTSRIDFNDYEHALARLRESSAFLEPHEGRLVMPAGRVGAWVRLVRALWSVC